MARDAVFLAASGAAPKTQDVAGTDYSRYSSKIFAKAYASGEDEIVQIVERAARHLGIGLANCANLLNPEIFVLGGGIVERLGARYLESVDRSMKAHAMPGVGDGLRLVEASLGDSAVTIGVAALVTEKVL